MENIPKGTGAGKKLTKTQIIIICGFAVVLLAIVIAGIFIYQALNKPVPEVTESNDAGSYVMDETNYEEIMGQMKEKVESSMYEVNMNAIWNFDNGEEPSSDAYVANSKANNKSVFFEVFLSETDELVYSSTVLPVGTKLKELKLDKSLEKGSYPAICKYNLLDDNGEVASKLSVAVTLNIAN